MKWYPILLIAAVAVFLIQATMYISNYYFDRAVSTYVENDNLQTFTDLVATSRRYNPFDLKHSLIEAQIYLEENKPQFALAILRRAEYIAPYNRQTQLLIGQVSTALNKDEQAEKAFRRAIILGPAQDMETYVELVALLKQSDKLEEARSVAKQGLTYFTEQILNSSLWLNRNKDEVKFHHLLLTTFLQNS